MKQRSSEGAGEAGDIVYFRRLWNLLNHLRGGLHSCRFVLLGHASLRERVDQQFSI